MHGVLPGQAADILLRSACCDQRDLGMYRHPAITEKAMVRRPDPHETQRAIAKASLQLVHRPWTTTIADNALDHSAANRLCRCML